MNNARNDLNTAQPDAETKSVKRILSVPFDFLRKIQRKISSLPGSYLIYCFIIPVVLMYLIYLSMEIHPFGDGSVLVLDLNGQYVYFFEALRRAVYGDASLLYSFSRALGGEFMGIYAYYLASPLSYIVALFPKERILEALLTIILLKTGLCGFTFGFYLHKNSAKTNKVVVVAFSVMYALCAYAVIYQNNIMWIDAMILLPLIAYSIEQLIKNRRYKLFVITVALGILSNFYIGYMLCIFVAVYFFYYYFAYNDSRNNPHGEKAHFLRSFIRLAVFSVLAVAIAAVIIFTAYYSLTFGKTTFSNTNWSFAENFEILDFLTKFLPGSYDTVRPEGLPLVYCGVLTLILVPVYFMSKKIAAREKIASLLLLAFFVLCFIVRPLDLIWHGFQRPNWLNYRQSFMFCFILLVLAYKGFGNLRKVSEKFLLGISAVIILFTAICGKLEFETYVESDSKLLQVQTVWLTISAVIACLVCLCLLIRTKSYRKRENICGILAAVVCIEIFCSSLACVVQFDSDVVYSKYSSYNNFVSGLRPITDTVKEEDTTFYRMEKVMHRKLNDNMALGIRGLSNSTSTLNSSTIAFLNKMGYASKSHWSKYLGGTPVNDSLLGIKYIIDYQSSSDLEGYYEKITSDEKYSAYRNPYALSVAYGVADAINDFNMEESSPSHFETLNSLISAMLGDQGGTEVFKPIAIEDTQTSNCIVDSISKHQKYSKINDSTTAYVTYTIIAPCDGEIYFYIPTSYVREVDLSVNGSGTGTFGGNETNRIICLGRFEEGSTVKVRLTLKDDPFYAMTGYNYFYYIDRECFDEAFERLLANPQYITDEGCTDDHITGKISTTEQDQTILTTIPYDKGWHVIVDGSEVEIYETLDALMTFRIADAGEHTLELKYMPTAFSLGSKITIIGIIVFAIICIAEFVIKKLTKGKYSFSLSSGGDTPWVLEDFDEDFEQSLAEPPARKKKKTADNKFRKFISAAKHKLPGSKDPESDTDAVDQNDAESAAGTDSENDTSVSDGEENDTGSDRSDENNGGDLN